MASKQLVVARIVHGPQPADGHALLAAGAHEMRGGGPVWTTSGMQRGINTWTSGQGSQGWSDFQQLTAEAREKRDAFDTDF